MTVDKFLVIFNFSMSLSPEPHVTVVILRRFVPHLARVCSAGLLDADPVTQQWGHTHKHWAPVATPTPWHTDNTLIIPDWRTHPVSQSMISDWGLNHHQQLCSCTEEMILTYQYYYYHKV